MSDEPQAQLCPACKKEPHIKDKDASEPLVWCENITPDPIGKCCPMAHKPFLLEAWNSIRIALNGEDVEKWPDGIVEGTKNTDNELYEYVTVFREWMNPRYKEEVYRVRAGAYCECCGKLLDFIPRRCCLRVGCPCGGKPIDAPVCSSECYVKNYKPVATPEEEEAFMKSLIQGTRPWDNPNYPRGG